MLVTVGPVAFLADPRLIESLWLDTMLAWPLVYARQAWVSLRPACRIPPGRSWCGLKVARHTKVFTLFTPDPHKL